jgi:hypothetical protein
MFVGLFIDIFRKMLRRNAISPYPEIYYEIGTLAGFRLGNSKRDNEVVK